MYCETAKNALPTTLECIPPDIKALPKGKETESQSNQSNGDHCTAQSSKQIK